MAIKDIINNTEQGAGPRVALRIALCVLTALAVLLALLFLSIAIVCYGPSVAARDLFVSTVMETSALKPLAHMYFSDEQVQSILSANSARSTDGISHGEGVVLPAEGEDFDINAITLEDIKGDTFVGKIMIVNDPSRVFVYCIDHFDENGPGEFLTDMVASSGATAAINGGAFYDPNGLGDGGMPQGIVIHQGKVMCDNPTYYPILIGFDSEHKLRIGKMDAKTALDTGIMEAVTFGPALVMDGKRVPISGNGGGLNPRSAIGQTADGRVILLVIDGRSPHSLGASYIDIADIMLEYGAVNAANLDGGSSSMLVYNGEILNTPAMFTGTRRMPSAILIR